MIKGNQIFNFDKKTTNLIFWVLVLFFEGCVEYLLGAESYKQMSLIRVFQYTFIPEALLIAFVKIPVCYTIAFFIFRTPKSKAINVVAKTMVVITLGILVHRIIFTVWNNYFINSIAPEIKDHVFNWNSIYSALMDNLFILGLFVGLKYYKMQSQWALREQYLEKEKLEYELVFLKGQINPHFLFNSLNNLFSIAQQKDNHELADSISKLSGMMRYMIYESNAALVPLEKEIAYIKNFIGLSKLRYLDEEVDVVLDFPETCKSVLIAPMILIPFVENAFKHGVVISKQSIIKLSIDCSSSYVVFKCVNAIHRETITMSGSEGGIGLENVKRRLNLIYPGKHELQIEENENFSITLKLLF